MRIDALEHCFAAVGARLLLSSGSYDEYAVHGAFEVRKPLEGKALLAAYQATQGYKAMIRWLEAEGYLCSLQCKELCLGGDSLHPKLYEATRR